MDFKLPILALTAFNFCLYGTRAILGGYIINSIIENTIDSDQSVVTYLFLQVTLIACMIGGAASVFGFFHFWEYTDTTRMVALGMGLMGVFMDLLATGYAGKQWERGPWDDKEDLEGRLQFMGAATVAEAFTMMLFVTALVLPIKKEEDHGGMTVEHQDEHEEEHIEKNSA